MNRGALRSVNLGRLNLKITLDDLVAGMRQGRAAILPAVLLLIAGAGVFFFIDIAHEMAEGEVQKFDRTVFLLFRTAGDISRPIGPEWLQEAAVEVTAIGGYTLITLAVAAVIGLLLVLRRYGPALYVFLSVSTGALVSTALKYYFERPRPDLVEHLDKVHTPSFPSGHALTTTLVYLTLAALVMRFFSDWRVRGYVLFIAVATALLVGLSRIYVGVHWPTDVAAGWALGTAWACLCWLVVSALQFYRRRRRRGDGEDLG